MNGMSVYFTVHSKCIFFIVKSCLRVLNNSFLLGIFLKLFHTNLSSPFLNKDVVLTNHICFTGPHLHDSISSNDFSIWRHGPARLFRWKSPCHTSLRTQVQSLIIPFRDGVREPTHIHPLSSRPYLQSCGVHQRSRRWIAVFNVESSCSCLLKSMAFLSSMLSMTWGLECGLSGQEHWLLLQTT